MQRASNRPSGDTAIPAPTGKGLAEPASRTTQKMVRWLAPGAIVGPVLFTLAWLILGFLSPGYTAWGVHIAPYSPISQGISGLGMGITAPFMNTAFVLCGVLTLIGVVGIFQGMREMRTSARWICIVLLALTPVGMILDGIFTLETFLPHMIGFLLATVGAVAGFAVTGLLLRRIERFRRFGAWLLLGSPLTLVLTILYFMTFSPTVAGTQTGIAGLTERILVVELLGWFVALAAFALKRSFVSETAANI